MSYGPSSPPSLYLTQGPDSTSLPKATADNVTVVSLTAQEPAVVKLYVCDANRQDQHGGSSLSSFSSLQFQGDVFTPKEQVQVSANHLHVRQPPISQVSAWLQMSCNMFNRELERVR
eukprot:m.124723 g.124723  ORF g.124723 m.124723 type:complete len:117 (-) comp15718_c2_seq1:2512-2862(-)